MVKDVDLLGAKKTAALNPGIGKVLLALFAEEQNSAFGRHWFALVSGQQFQGQKSLLIQLSVIAKCLLCRFDVQIAGG